ncbi:MAG: DinB family protein [Acidobacteriaceae bacterium]|nr:DinB family protein [Acidobacteriaceae bacterium]
MQLLRNVPSRWICALSCATVACALARGQGNPVSPAQEINKNFDYVNQKVLAMAEDFPADKYGYRPKPEMRSFGEVIVHIASGNVYAAKAGRGEKVDWDELDPKNYRTKAEIVALFQKSVTDADTTLKAVPAESFAKSLGPWVGVMEHSAEHYGLLVAYYRLNGIVPPDSRPKGK